MEVDCRIKSLAWKLIPCIYGTFHSVRLITISSVLFVKTGNYSVSLTSATLRDELLEVRKDGHVSRRDGAEMHILQFKEITDVLEENPEYHEALTEQIWFGCD